MAWAIDEIPPLPNLGHRIGCGNSLLAPTEPAVYGSEAGLAGAPSFGGVTALEEDHRREVCEVQQAFFEAHGAEKAELQRRLDGLETDIQRRLLEARRTQLQEKIDPYDRLEASEDLFGGEVELDEDQRRTRDEFRDELEAVETAIADLEADRQRRGGFAFAARFGPVLDEDGFDVVVTNPPWIRANRLTSARRKLLESRYRSYSNELWEGADELGIRVPFGAQVDVAALFIERALELLRTGGRLAALVPSKLFRSLHGTGLRRRLADERLEVLRDYGDSDRQMFDATVYPAIVQVEKATERQAPRRRRGSARRAPTSREPRNPDNSFDVTVWQGSRKQSWSTGLADVLTLGRDVGEPWAFVPPAIADVFGRMRSRSTPLGAIEDLQPERGLMTGRNQVFLVDDEEARDRLGDRAEEWTRSALSGRDVRAWTVDPERRLIWAYDEDLEPRAALPDALARYFERHADELQSRADYNPNGPLWQLFRLKPGLVQPKVVWRDLAPRLEAGLAGEAVVPLNTVYFIPLVRRCDAEAAMALFNSEPVRAVAYAIGERARGGWRRHFAWVMRLLPVPDAFVDRLAGGESWEAVESADLRAPPSSDVRDRLDRWAAKLFGLDAADLRRLKDWRQDENDEMRGAA
ncbi:MAG: Eco57I restriction-modification methylase domain-containing protein [Bradymonadaceae bacterium]